VAISRATSTGWLQDDETVSLSRTTSSGWVQQVAATSVTLSYLRPSADISTGSWTPSTGTTLYETLDEVSASDADYIQTSIASSCEIRLAAGATPLTKTNHTLKYNLLAGSGTVTVKLVQGTTVKKTWNHTLTGSTQQISNTLTEAEANTITDYSDLRVRFET